MITLRRKRNAAGEWIYQVRPADLPSHQREPRWGLLREFDPAVQGALVACRLFSLFVPLPYDDSLEEAELTQEEYGSFFHSTEDDDAAGDREYPEWGKF
jgi:hypothetical protein